MYLILNQYYQFNFTAAVFSINRVMYEGLDGGVWYSLFIKNLAHYSSH